VIVAVVAWGRFVRAVMAVVVNAGVVMGAGISVDVTRPEHFSGRAGFGPG
jgi:hypothetical protein